MQFTCTATKQQFDAFAIIKQIDEIEQKHRLQVKDGRVEPNEGFLHELAITFQVSKTVAFALWVGVSKVVDQLRKRHRELAEIAYWYKIDPYGLTPEQKFGLLANLPVVQAQQRLADGNFESTDYKYIHDLVLLATGSKEKARKARATALERYVDQQTGFK